MTRATVKYIANGYIVSGVDFPPTIPQPLYALTIPEVVYWLGRIFDPIVIQEPIARTPAPVPRIIDPGTDPLLGQMAEVGTVASGGFLVTQIPSLDSGSKFVEVYAANMDSVAQLLTAIYTPPASSE